MVSGTHDVVVQNTFGTVGGESSNGSSDVEGYRGSNVIEELSLKYGGYLRARRAATIIQQAFRQYSMSCSFAKLRLEAGESRRSRRFGNRRVIGEKTNGEHQQNDAVTSREDTRSEATSSDNLRTCDATSRQPPAIERPAGLGLQIEDALNTVAAILMQQTSPSDDAAGGDLYDGELSEHGGDCSSSRSLSPLPPPMDPVATAGGDLPSVCFETMLDDEGGGTFFGMAQKSSRSNAAGDSLTPGMFPSGLSSSQGGRCNHVVGNPKESGIKKFFDFPHLPVLGGANNSQSHFVNINGQPKPIVGHHQNGSCGGSCSEVVSCGHRHTPSSVACSHRKHVCPTSSCGPHATVNGPASNASASHVNAPACGVGNPCPFTNVPVSYFNLSSGGYHSESSPIWKRKSSSMESCDGNAVGGCFVLNADDDFCRRERPWSDLYPGSTTSSEDAASIGSGSNNEMAPVSSHHHHFAYYRPGVECVSSDARMPSATTSVSAPSSGHNSLTDRQRKRSYRIGLNLFNKHPEEGMRYLMAQRFVDNRPSAVARFLITRKGLSRQKIGDYLGNLQQRFNMDVLGTVFLFSSDYLNKFKYRVGSRAVLDIVARCFAEEVDLTGMTVDDALRNFQSYFRMPGEAQKIERLMEAFSSCYCECNPDVVRRFRRADTVFLLAFAIIMLNTDLHNKNVKLERKMKLEDFIRNLRGIDGGEDIDRDLLAGIYERTSLVAFKPASDHVTQVMKVEQMIIGKKPVLAVPHRRLVCYCRLYEVLDPSKRDRTTGQHQREIFLFNDMLMITKSLSKKKENVMYSFRQSMQLYGMVVYIFETPHYQFGIQLTADNGSRILGTYCARNERDRAKFVEDLREAIAEMNEMVLLEARGFRDLQADGCVESLRNGSALNGDFDVRLTTNRLSAPECGGDSVLPLRKSLTSSSLIDVSEGDHSGSSASLDSGLPSTSSGSTASCQEMGHGIPHGGTKPPTPQHQLPPSNGNKFNLFVKKGRATSKSSPNGNAVAEL